MTAPTGSQVYVFNEEEICALVDMASFDSVDVVNEAFRNTLLLNLAKAAVATINGSRPSQSIDCDGKSSAPPQDLCDTPLVSIFVTHTLFDRLK
jgi:hypothetical protein